MAESHFVWRISVAVWRRDEAPDAMASPALELADADGVLGRVEYETEGQQPGWSAFAYPRDGEWRPHQENVNARGDRLFRREGQPRLLGTGETKRPVRTAAIAPGVLIEMLADAVPAPDRATLVAVASSLTPVLEKVVQAHGRRVAQRRGQR